MAWLNGVPKPDPDSARGKSQAAQPTMTRLEDAKRRKITPPMPPNPAPHIVDRLVEMGITEAAGMGAVALSWREIVAWQEGTWVRLAPWEARLIRDLSKAYLAESRIADSENCPAPWHSGPTRQAIETEQARLEAVLG
ncbi:hypothetical protein LPN01_09705 [Sphingomonas sp. A2-49]|uniref:hypothetical protein n=1 Tax=Sphingomonas sp. A2-49 TaxID=1391375 RepID=UPI0021CE3EDA|nr:hypothetical protein [Sphingomonas sp. A2-49]MCU6454354.1 hypothetical protein [Sphingomonas sp. A2-49]